MTLPDPELAAEQTHALEWKNRILHSGSIHKYGGAFTDNDGHVSFAVEISWGHREGWISGFSFQRESPPRFYGLGCVLIDAAELPRGTTVDPRLGTWSDHPANDHFKSKLLDGSARTYRINAELDLGTIRRPPDQ